MTPVQDPEVVPLAKRAERAGFRVERLLGRGAMGAVFAAVQEGDGRRLAVKVMGAELEGEVDRARFLREGRLAAALNHPHAVFVYGVTEVDGVPLIAMELVEGHTLEERVEREGPLGEAAVLDAMVQVVDGLEAAAARGILHRDIKPANCFVDHDGRVKVGDFGLSRPVDEREELRLTAAGAFLGTPLYAAPEQLLGQALDVRADIYGVGATMYFLLTRTHPHPATNIAQLMAMVFKGIPVPVTTVRPDLSPALAAVVMRCVAHDRADRFAGYADLRAALLACRPLALVPAPAGRRVMAGVLDNYVLAAGTAPVAIAVGRAGGIPEAAFTTDPTTAAALLSAAVSLPLELGWFALLEGRFGWSPAKRLLGLRVVGADGGAPGLRRAVRRTLVTTVPAVAGAAATALVATADGRASVNAAVFGALAAALFLRARPGNGWLAEQDRWSGSRVIWHHPPPPEAAGPVIAAPAPVSQDEPRTGERIGPFVVMGTLDGATEVLRAWDAVLAREVWVHRHPPGTPLLEALEREVPRRSALRRVGSRRTAAEAWDAYAAIDGMPLAERLRHDAAWPTCRRWLMALAAEVDAPRHDVPVEALTRRHLWVTPDDGLVVLPFPVGDAGDGGRAIASGGVPERPEPIAAALARALAEAPALAEGRARWSFAARRLLSEASHPGATGASLLAVADREVRPSAGMTVARRLLLWGVTVAPLSAVAGFLVLVARLAGADTGFDPWRPSVRVMDGAFALALLTALLSRRGPMLRMLGIEVLTAAGTRAPRWRCLLRQLLAWGPATLLAHMCLPTPAWRNALPPEALWAGTGVLLAWVAAFAVTGWRAPHCSFLEWLTGTRLVPE